MNKFIFVEVDFKTTPATMKCVLCGEVAEVPQEKSLVMLKRRIEEFEVKHKPCQG